MATNPAFNFSRSSVVVRTAACIACLNLAGCPAASLPRTQAIDAEAINAVQTEIKRQVGDYLRFAYSERIPTDQPNRTADLACPAKAIDFHIESILLDLQTTLDNKSGVTADVKGPPIAPISLNVDGDFTQNNTQKLTFKQYVIPDGYYEGYIKKGTQKRPSEDDSLATLLTHLHKGLLAARGSYPCLTGINLASEDSANSNSYVIGLTFTDRGKLGIGIAAGPLILAASHERTFKNTNTLTVSFRQINRASIPVIKSKLNGSKGEAGQGYQLCRRGSDQSFLLFWCDKDLRMIPFEDLPVHMEL
ncbi:hypothetical protein [Achromobacter piechaudii]|uniref:hypothetical protein n=1 Tax=Achromobacter piechaudii TaxID=72556 RepID=UPI000AA1D877|nr:hypothetical protein [Achromobacter piechaudii]